MVMRAMREHTKWIMLLTAVAFVALMVFEWGMDASGQSSGIVGAGELGRVNGQAITYDEWITTYRELYDQQQREVDGVIPPHMNRQIEDAAWEQVVMAKLIDQQIRERGIRVTPAEVRQAARYAPPPEFIDNELFQTDGEFDLQKYHEFLASPAVDQELLVALERYYRERIPRNKLFQQVVAGLYVSDSELWRLWRDRNERVQLSYIAIDPQSRIPDEQVVISEQEVRTYYQANQEQFRRPARATVKVASIGKAPTAADTASARARAEEVRREIVEGADFAEVARRESQDRGSAEQGGDLGYFPRGQTVPSFEQAVWSQPIGEPGEPVLSRFGYHVIEVIDREEGRAHARHILIPVEQSHESEDRMLMFADSLESMGMRMPIEPAAAQLGLPVRTVEISPDLAVVPGVGAAEEGSDWAFEEAERGEVSPVFEGQDAFYMMELVQRTPEGTLSLAEAEPAIRGTLHTRKKMELAREFGGRVLQDIRTSGLRAGAERHGLEVREAGPFARVDAVPGLGQASPAVGAAFGLPQGGTSGLVESEGTLYILRLNRRTEPDREEFEQQKEVQRARALQGLEQEQINLFLAELRERARIVDSREQVLSSSPSPDRPLGPPPPF